jgi:hypothetical protein
LATQGQHVLTFQIPLALSPLCSPPPSIPPASLAGIAGASQRRKRSQPLSHPGQATIQSDSGGGRGSCAHSCIEVTGSLSRAYAGPFDQRMQVHYSVDQHWLRPTLYVSCECG